MRSIHEENGVCHPCFLMKKQAEHQRKNSFYSPLKHCSFEIRCRLLRSGPAFQNNFENAADSMLFPGSWC